MPPLDPRMLWQLQSPGRRQANLQADVPRVPGDQGRRDSSGDGQPRVRRDRDYRTHRRSHRRRGRGRRCQKLLRRNARRRGRSRAPLSEIRPDRTIIVCAGLRIEPDCPMGRATEAEQYGRRSEESPRGTTNQLKLDFVHFVTPPASGRRHKMDKVETRRPVMRKSESNAEKNSRRKFIKTAAAGAMAAGSFVRASGSPKRFVLEPEPEPEQQVSANDRIRIGLIGAGGMGFGDTETALRVPGVELGE